MQMEPEMYGSISEIIPWHRNSRSMFFHRGSVCRLRQFILMDSVLNQKLLSAGVRGAMPQAMI